MGVVDTRHGSGTQVAESGTDVLKTPLEFLFMLDRPSIEDLVETRTLLEVHLAGMIPVFAVVMARGLGQ
jgi:DNA-binding FadR family transcriptional regulator